MWFGLVIMNIRQLPIKGNRYFSVVKVRDIQAVTNDRVRMARLIDDSVSGAVQDVDDPSLLLLVGRMLASAAAAALAILARVDGLDVLSGDDHWCSPFVSLDSARMPKKATGSHEKFQSSELRLEDMHRGKRLISVDSEDPPHLIARALDLELLAVGLDKHLCSPFDRPNFQPNKEKGNGFYSVAFSMG